MPAEPFSYRRRVAFGDCDPARIYYTPRAFDYCVEAIGAWWESTLSVSWTDLLARRGLEVRFSRAEFEFLRPLTAGQRVEVRIRVPETGRTRLTFRATGAGESGEPHFRAILTAGLVDRTREGEVPVPAAERERIVRYEASLGSAETAPAAAREGSPGPGGERGASRRGRGFPAGLFTCSRRVVYGECGPSGTVHAPRVFDFVVEAAGEWFEKIPGISWLELISVRRHGAPAVAASCEYHRPMTAGQPVGMGVRVYHLGRSTIGLSIEGNDPEGLPLFDSRIMLCYIDQESGFRSMPVPEEYRRRILEYQTACG